MARVRRSRPPQSPAARAVRVAVRVVLPVIFALGLWHLFTNVVRFGYVFSASMEPTCAEGEPYLKRVIAVGGDEVAIINGVVWLNGLPLEEPYLKERAQPERPIVGEVSDGRLCVLGDNRNFSADSRDTGFVAAAEVMGQVTHIVWPRERARSLVIRK